MKKIITKIALVIVLIFSLSGCASLGNLFNSEATTDTTESVVEEASLSDAELSALIQEIYDTVIAQITDETYDEIYAQVLESLNEKIASGEITVSADSVQEAILQVLSSAKSSIVGVTNIENSSLGSGVIYQKIGTIYYVITNYHVVEDGTTFEIEFSDGDSVEATLIGYDTEVDIALLTFNAEGLDQTITVSALGDSDTLAEGSFVLAIGNPEGYDYYGSVTLGVVSGTDRVLDGDYFIGYIQHDAAINSGNSGGALFNLAGEVIGINTAKLAATEIEGMGFAIPINLVKEVIANILAGNDETIKPVLGATILDVSENVEAGVITITTTSTVSGPMGRPQTVTTEEEFTLPSGVTSGLFISSVTAGSSIDDVIEYGDVIVQIDDYAIDNLADYMDYFYDHYRNGDTVSLVYYEYENETYASTPTTVSITLK